MARHAEIAGAGFAGLTLAICLRQRGWTVRVHEVAEELRAFGAGIFLWENGIEVLRAIGAYDQVIARAHEAPFFDDRTDAGELIFSKPLPLPQGSRMITLTRQHLYAPIIDVARRVGVEVITGSDVSGATPSGQLRLNDGSLKTADLAVGADGIRSKIRSALGLEQEHQVFPVGIFRTLVPHTPEESSQPFWRRIINFWSERRRVLYVPCNPEELYVLLGARLPDAEGLELPFNAATWSATFPSLASIFFRIKGEMRFDQYEVVRCSRWSSGRSALIGDAAHAMPPTMGQGAGTAMTNALELACCLDEHASIETALAAWETKMRPLTEHTQKLSVRRTTEWMPTTRSERAQWSDDAARPAMHFSSRSTVQERGL